MATLPVALQYRVSVTVADDQMDNPPVWGFSSGYTLAYMKEKIRRHLREMGYDLVRLRQELTEDVSIEVRSEETFGNIVRRAARLEYNPIIDLIAYVKEL